MITEDRIREIIREEIKSLMSAMSENASQMDGYYSDAMESRALSAIGSVCDWTSREMTTTD